MSANENYDWIPVTQDLPPITDPMLFRSLKVGVATDELNEGQGIAYYCDGDEEEGEEPRWITSCSNAFELNRVTHWRRLPPLPTDKQ